MQHDRVSVDYSLRMALAEGEYLPSPESLDDDEGFPCEDDGLLAFLSLVKGSRPRKGLLPERLLSEVSLMKKLSGRCPLPKVADTKYPVWAIAATEYYEGYLTVREMRALAPDRSNGYFDYVQRALKYGSEAKLMSRVLEQLRVVREKLLGSGAGSLCVSVEV
jgi:hypothetical protein